MKVLNTILNYTYQPLQELWDKKQTARLFSNILVMVFLSSLVIALVNYLMHGAVPKLLRKVDFLGTIEICFTVLLFIEMLGLVFVIPYSISNSIGKQIQILSLVLLRSSFEEFSHFNFDMPFTGQLPSVYKMFTDAIGAALVFLLLSVYYGIQRHRSLTEENEKDEFIALKKLIALFVLISLIILGFGDMYRLWANGTFVQSVHQFYLILIFADLLFMLIAFRYIIHYPNIFRYSAFVVVTIFIRMSLLAPVYYNTAFSVVSVLFAISVVYFHNLFMDGRLKYINNEKLK